VAEAGKRKTAFSVFLRFLTKVVANEKQRNNGEYKAKLLSERPSYLAKNAEICAKSSRYQPELARIKNYLFQGTLMHERTA